MSPTGSIFRGGDGVPDADPYRLVAVEPGIAWLRNSVETRVIKPGDVAPGLGRIAAIVERQGRWTLVDNSGAVLLAADPARLQRRSGRPVFTADDLRRQLNLRRRRSSTAAAGADKSVTRAGDFRCLGVVLRAARERPKALTQLGERGNCEYVTVIPIVPI